MRHVPRRPRGVLIAVMLLASLLVASLLALQAHRTFLHHRATAERVLRDYARLAASRFALRTGYNLYYMAAWPQMEALLRTQVGAPGAPLPRPERLAPGLKPDAAAALKRARYTFRLDLTSGRLATSGAKLYHSPVQYAATFSARDTVEAMMGGMQVAVALRPELASKLVIGGLPRSRLPLLLGALGLTAGLIVTALVQLRREYELARLRTDFVSGVSHELRTPPAQIRMFSETLLLGRVRSEEEGRRSLEIIDQESRRLTHLVENLLHFSRSERQVTRLSPARAPLAPLVQEALEGFAPLAGARGVRLRSELAEGVVAPVDAEAFRQMLLNLLDNAIKYGPPGQVVTVGLAAADQRARIWVDDQGPGIPAADRERVWDRFWRLERDRGSAVAGTGIGLAVVRELVALHGGRAWAEDGQSGTPPAGARGVRFVIELPLEPSPQVPGHAGGPSSVPA